MGLKDYIKGQLLDVIEWEDTTQDTIVHKIDMRNNEIQNGAWLTVRPGQCAVFVNEGQIADIFHEGRHQLTTRNLPILSSLKHWKYGFNSSFKSDVYFINLKQFTNQKWGTPTPIYVCDPKFEQVEIRAFGIFSFRVKDPEKFMKEVVSTNRIYKTNDIKEQLKAFINTHFASIVGGLNLSIADYSKNYANISDAILNALKEDFQRIGLEITSFTVSSITLPDEINETLRIRTKANMLGGLGNYTQVETLDIMKEAAKNPGMNSMNQAGIGFGMGLGLGQIFANNMQGSLNNQTQFYNPSDNQVNLKNNNTDSMKCPNCSTVLSNNAKFCIECGMKIEKDVSNETKYCPECSSKNLKDAKFCMECGFKF